MKHGILLKYPPSKPPPSEGVFYFYTCVVSAKDLINMFTEELRQQLLLTVRLNSMICIEAEIPPEIYDIDDELKAIYHSRDSFCIWVFSTRVDRNRFVEETIGMSKDQRQEHFNSFS